MNSQAERLFQLLLRRATRAWCGCSSKPIPTLQTRWGCLGACTRDDPEVARLEWASIARVGVRGCERVWACPSGLPNIRRHEIAPSVARTHWWIWCGRLEVVSIRAFPAFGPASSPMRTHSTEIGICWHGRPDATSTSSRTIARAHARLHLLWSMLCMESVNPANTCVCALSIDYVSARRTTGPQSISLLGTIV